MSKEKGLREELYRICDDTKTSRKGIDYLINYYTNSLGWDEKKAIKYTIELFKNGTIEQIKVIGGNGENII